ncbi:MULTISPECIES: hypothetical protein [unclassified Campylobacter]|uniref:hypothetical protein n=1 Tax=unclassified Campylobacter TaxID=2593542 RepID=UPI001239F9CD|nr:MULTISPECIES: hypothetical protein [unclassified Campylobacter]KAA6225211.1 hypothetical protein FMM55_08035 [Campylobacter sp. LR196d]KAA6231424.1 hypothetical protein FMM56_04560 [Campylobacter sp. LR264d]KAA6231636.1 hypothetical protein FMM58_03350 [Campylobacter sp. LR291e]
MARSGTAKDNNARKSNKQIASYYYLNHNKKVYFYYDANNNFSSLLEGDYYFKINEINKDTGPSFLKTYPFELGKSWG